MRSFFCVVEYEKKGLHIKNEGHLRAIFSHMRPPTPPRTKEAYGERLKDAVEEKLKKTLPPAVKKGIKIASGVVGLSPRILARGGSSLYDALPERGQATVKGSS